MRRRDLIGHLEAHGCEFVREGKEHTLYINRQMKRSTAVPRPSRDSRRHGASYLPRSRYPLTNEVS